MYLNIIKIGKYKIIHYTFYPLEYGKQIRDILFYNYGDNMCMFTFQQIPV